VDGARGGGLVAREAQGRRPTINRRVLGAFTAAVALHALWDTLAGAGGSLVVWLMGLLVAAASLALLIRRVREAARAGADRAADRVV